MEMIDVLAKMDERLARQDEILADQNRLLEHITRLVDMAREEAQAGRETSARILQRMVEWDIRHDRTWERVERALTTLEQTLRQRGGLQR